MFENLSDRLTKTLKNISGRGRLTEDNIKETLREVRMALLEADVALPVIREFIANVKTRAVGQEVSKSLSPGQIFVKIVQSELESAMGEANEGFAEVQRLCAHRRVRARRPRLAARSLSPGCPGCDRARRSRVPTR